MQKREVKISDRYATGFWEREAVGWRVMRKVNSVGKLDNCCQCVGDVVVEADWGLKAVVA